MFGIDWIMDFVYYTEFIMSNKTLDIVKELNYF